MTKQAKPTKGSRAYKTRIADIAAKEPSQRTRLEKETLAAEIKSWNFGAPAAQGSVIKGTSHPAQPATEAVPYATIYDSPALSRKVATCATKDELRKYSDAHPGLFADQVEIRGIGIILGWDEIDL
jgi:hypothetical protein